MRDSDENAKTYAFAINHFENQIACIKAMQKVLEHFNNSNWEFYRVDNGSGFWLKSPSGKSFAIHYKHGHYGDLEQSIEVNNYNFYSNKDEKYTNFEISPDMADKIIKHLYEFEEKPLNY